MTGRQALEPDPIEPFCVACGCTEFSPCETNVGPCAWLIYPRVSGRGLCTGCSIHYRNPTATFAQAEALLNRRRQPPPDLPPPALRGRFPDHGKPRKPVKS